MCVMHGYDVAGYHVRGVVHGLFALGLDVHGLLRDAGIERRALEDPEARFAEAQLFALWLQAEQRYGKPAFGLALAMHIPFGRLELVDYLIAACPTVGAGIESLQHHAKLCASGFSFRLESDSRTSEPGKTVFLEHRHGVECLPRSLVEYLWMLVILRLRGACGSAFTPELALRKLPEGPTLAYRDALGRAPKQSDADAMFVSESQWQLENPRRDPCLRPLLEAHARDVSARLPEEGFQAAARYAVIAALHRGEPSITYVAARLGLTPRTLQRRLEDDATTFQELVDLVRRELALRYLEQTQLSLGEISALLAYAEPSAFGRAFRRWTGTTPAHFRRETKRSLS